MPLARAVRYAIERQRRTAASAPSPVVDQLTRTLNRPGFIAVAEHYARLAFESHIDLLLANLEIEQLPERSSEDREARELLLMRAGEALREVFEAPALIGHLDGCRFGLIVPGLAESTVEGLLQTAAAKIEDAWIGNAATVRFSVAELNPRDSIQELFSDGEFAGEARWHTKTAMLAD